VRITKRENIYKTKLYEYQRNETKFRLLYCFAKQTKFREIDIEFRLVSCFAKLKKHAKLETQGSSLSICARKGVLWTEWVCQQFDISLSPSNCYVRRGSPCALSIGKISISGQYTDIRGGFLWELYIIGCSMAVLVQYIWSCVPVKDFCTILDMLSAVIVISIGSVFNWRLEAHLECGPRFRWGKKS
jgi:hypothetical protein